MAEPNQAHRAAARANFFLTFWSRTVLILSCPNEQLVGPLGGAGWFLGQEKTNGRRPVQGIRTSRVKGKDERPRDMEERAK